MVCLIVVPIACGLHEYYWFDKVKQCFKVHVILSRPPPYYARSSTRQYSYKKDWTR